ncbi:MAG: glutamine-hydrolyzing carbamoyl-phosphate synthase small subunit [Phycisphaerales bacterium]|nr:glutamine-hydrolyzing carbamoyl-phosphate synthase small subunit [Phycisphaerales bacterium]
MNTNTKNKPSARLALADGYIYSGVPFGAVNKQICQTGEVVFNTAMTGYEESLTDPSYTGQILIQTTPLIGNTGVNPVDIESGKIQVAGFVIHEHTQHHSNYRADCTLSAMLDEADVLGIAAIDTRALTRHLRTQGVVQGVLTDRTDLSDQELVDIARSAASMAGQDLATNAGVKHDSEWTETLGDWPANSAPANFDRQPTVLLIDCGVKHNIARNLAARGVRVLLVPSTITHEQIRARYEAGEADGLFVSNGPGDPDAVEAVISTLRSILNDVKMENFPVFGICLGNQLLAIALGAKTYKLPFGHRGANHPVLNLLNGRVEITSQNHGFAVDRESLEKIGGQVTHLHLNDQTVAGFRMPHKPVRAVQFHPEASPGPHDSSGFFDAFLRALTQPCTS